MLEKWVGVLENAGKKGLGFRQSLGVIKVSSRRAPGADLCGVGGNCLECFVLRFQG